MCFKFQTWVLLQATLGGSSQHQNWQKDTHAHPYCRVHGRYWQTIKQKIAVCVWAWWRKKLAPPTTGLTWAALHTSFILLRLRWVSSDKVSKTRMWHATSHLVTHFSHSPIASQARVKTQTETNTSWSSMSKRVEALCSTCVWMSDQAEAIINQSWRNRPCNGDLEWQISKQHCWTSAIYSCPVNTK